MEIVNIPEKMTYKNNKIEKTNEGNFKIKH